MVVGKSLFYTDTYVSESQRDEFETAAASTMTTL